MQKIEERNGYLYLVDRWTRSDEPVIDVMGWAIVSHGRPVKVDRYNRHLIGKTVVRQGNLFIIASNNQYVNVNTQQAGFREQIAVPRPKSRVELRWHRGRWEKYLKAKGWVPC